MSAARAAVERAFGQLVLSFQILKQGIHVSTVSKARLVVHACLVLHNVRKHLGQPDVVRSNATGGELASMADALAYVRLQGDDRVGARRPEESHLTAEMCRR